MAASLSMITSASLSPWTMPSRATPSGPYRGPTASLSFCSFGGRGSASSSSSSSFLTATASSPLLHCSPFSSSFFEGKEMAVAAMAIFGSRTKLLRFRVECCDSKPGQGFGPKNTKTSKVTTEGKGKGLTSNERTTSNQSGPSLSQAPGISSRFDGQSNANTTDMEFEDRLATIRRSALEQKKADEIKQFGPIDYDAPVETEKKPIGIGTKIGVGVAVVVFGLVFALGDFLPSGSDISNRETTVVEKKLSEEEKATLQTRLKGYEETLGISPKDPTALEGAAVTLAEMGEYTRSATLLQDLAKEKPTDPDVFRLLGEVKYALKDFDGSIAAYKLSTMVSKDVDFEVLRGYTDALLAAKRPDEAVQVLRAAQERLNSEGSAGIKAENGATGADGLQDIDPIQVNLLLGKAYTDWGHVSDAISVYDQLISSHPDDFRGYLAKGILLKANGSTGDAERMFIQARFYAPQKAKAFVDRFAKK